MGTTKKRKEKYSLAAPLNVSIDFLQKVVISHNNRQFKDAILNLNKVGKNDYNSWDKGKRPGNVPMDFLCEFLGWSKPLVVSINNEMRRIDEFHFIVKQSKRTIDCVWIVSSKRQFGNVWQRWDLSQSESNNNNNNT